MVAAQLQRTRSSRPPAPNRAADRSRALRRRFQKKLEYLAMVSRKVFAGRPARRAPHAQDRLRRRVRRPPHYARGDDFRYLDWNVYGRLDKLLLRLFEEEEDLSHLLPRRRARTRWRSARRCRSCTTRSRSARRSPTSASRTSTASRSSRSATGCIERMPPTRGKDRIFRVFDFLRTCDIGGKTELAECMKDFVAQNKRRGLAVVISDFYDPTGFEQGINVLRYNKFEPFVLQVYDMREAEPEAARRRRARRLRDRRHARGHGLASRCSRRTSASTRSTARSSRRTARSTRCRSSARTRRSRSTSSCSRSSAREASCGELPRADPARRSWAYVAGRRRARSRSARTSSRCGGAASRCRSRSCGSASSSRRTPTRCGSS